MTTTTTCGGESFGNTRRRLPADGNGNGVVDAADYVVWREQRRRIGPRGGAAGGAATVPEPATAAIIVRMVCLCLPARRYVLTIIRESLATCRRLHLLAMLVPHWFGVCTHARAHDQRPPNIVLFWPTTSATATSAATAARLSRRRGSIAWPPRACGSRSSTPARPCARRRAAC